MTIVTNNTNIPLALAVWLLDDDYDYINEPNYVSATTLMKPTRQLILPKRVPKEMQTSDVSDFVSSAMGKTFHAGVERAWLRDPKKALRRMGYSESIIERILVNPTPEQLAAVKEPIAIYVEQREIREFEGFKIGGKFDMVADGIVHDVKSTTAYTWLKGTRDEDYAIQGSIYKWLNPTKITEDFIRIAFIFTDWQAALAKQNPNYPQQRLMYKDIPLWTTPEIEVWMRGKLSQLVRYANAADKDIPECTAEELWQSEPQYKYYSDPTKTAGRATKNFDDFVEARQFMADKGGKGIIITVPGEPKRCGYCNAAPICEQRKRLFNIA